MARVTGEERALSRAAIYRLLGLSFTYPTRDAVTDLRRAASVARMGAGVIGAAVFDAAEDLARVVEGVDQATLEASFQRAFTLSYNEDCPVHETAFSARHIFQQTQHQADIAGFYRAFGVDARAERADHLSVELEFMYLLAVKEATARDGDEAEHVKLCRQAQRSFVRDHAARWMPLIAQRIDVAAGGGFYSAAARLLGAFVASEEKFLRLGNVARFRDEPVLIADEPGEMTCPMAATPVPMPNNEREGFEHAVSHTC